MIASTFVKKKQEEKYHSFMVEQAYKNYSNF